jgi:hypothetical protein
VRVRHYGGPQRPSLATPGAVTLSSSLFRPFRGSEGLPLADVEEKGGRGEVCRGSVWMVEWGKPVGGWTGFRTMAWTGLGGD